jgi:hypothetical protein
MSLYEIKKANNEKIEEMDRKLKKYFELNDIQSKIINDFKYNEEKLRSDLEEIEKSKKKLEIDLSEKLGEISTMKFEFHKEKAVMEQILENKKDLINRRLPFDDTQNKFYNSLSGRNINKEHLVILKIIKQ